MPLSHGKSKEAVSQNIKTEMEAGKPQEQAVAIALNTAREAGAHIPKKAEGGTVEPGDQQFADEFRQGFAGELNHDSDAVKSYLSSKFHDLVSVPTEDSVAKGRDTSGGMADGGSPRVAALENESPAQVDKDTHLGDGPRMADGGTIHRAEGRDKEPARPADADMSHEKKLGSIYRAMGIKQYADGGAVSPSELPGGGMPIPSSGDPTYWDKIKVALQKLQGSPAPLEKPVDTTGVGFDVNSSNAPVVAPAMPPAAPPVALPPPPVQEAPAPKLAPTVPAPVTAQPPKSPDLGGIFKQDTSKLTEGMNAEDRQALAERMRSQQHGLGSVVAQAVAGLGDALAAKGGREQHSLQGIFSMQKEQRDEALANFDKARQDRLQKLSLQTQMGMNTLQQLAAQDAYGTDEHLNTMLGAPPGTAHKDLSLYFQMKAAQVAAQEKDADLYMKAHAQAVSEVDAAVKNASVLSIKPSAEQLRASGAKLADQYYNRAKGNILVKPSDGGQAQWIPAANISKAKQMDPNLQVMP